jgi:hypothetical protein
MISWIVIGVVVDQDRGDGLGLGLAGPGAGGQDLVAGPELADGDGGAGGEHDSRASGEGIAAAAEDSYDEIVTEAVVVGTPT